MTADTQDFMDWEDGGQQQHLQSDIDFLQGQQTQHNKYFINLILRWALNHFRDN